MTVILPNKVAAFAPSDNGYTRRKFTRDEYHRLADTGFFQPSERLELLDGEIIEKMPQNRPHSIAVQRTAAVTAKAFGPEFHAETQMPVALATDGEPEPDVMILPGAPEDYLDIPTQNDVRLIVEVSDTTLQLDRGKKARQYAEAGIEEYWVIDINERKLEVRRKPVATSDDVPGHDYSRLTVYTEGESVAPLHAPTSQVAVSELLPPLSTKEIIEKQ